MADVTPLIRDELLPPRGPQRRHLISIPDLTKDDVERLLALARTFSASLDREVKKLPALKGRTVVNMFFESSTRTSSSFELAAKRLSADVMSIKASGSAVDKGESLKDTALTIGAYDPDVIVLRHPLIGAPQVIANATAAHVVELRAGRETALGRRHVHQGLRLRSGQGRVVEGHGAHDRRVRPRRHRPAAPAHRRAAGDRLRDHAARRQCRGRDAPSND